MQKLRGAAAQRVDGRGVMTARGMLLTQSTMTTTEFIDKNISKLEAQLELWSAKLNEATAKLRVTQEQAKIESQKQLEELKVQLDVARTKLDEAKAVGAEKWEALKKGLESAWADLERTFKQLKD